MAVCCSPVTAQGRDARQAQGRHVGGAEAGLSSSQEHKSARQDRVQKW